MRPLFFHITSPALFYLLALAAAVSCGLGLALHLARWATGRRDQTYTRLNLRAFLLNGLLGRRIFAGDLPAGLAHLALMWGFGLLFLGTVLLTIHHHLWPFLQGGLSLAYALVLDLAGLAFLLGLVLAAGRRYLWGRARMRTTAQDALVLLLLFVLGLTGFLVEGARLALKPGPDLAWSPGGAAVAAWLTPAFPELTGYYRTLWWIHALLGLTFVGSFVYLKLFHLLAAPLNLLWTGRPTEFLTLDQREENPQEFGLDHLVMFEACTECNRCEEVCPAFAAGEPLSPRDFVQRVKGYARLKYTWLRRFDFFRERAGQKLRADPRLDPDLAWLCTTCRACLEVCPALIEPMSVVTEIRRPLVEQGGHVPAPLARALEGVHKYQNPWLKPRSQRGAWAADLGLKDLNTEAAEWLYFAGCTVSFDERLIQMARAGTALLRQAGVDLGLLGREEPCCGDVPRRLGEDGLFEMLAEANLEFLAELGIKRIVTASPHCAQTLKTEYPPLARALDLPGPGFEVRHQTELAAELIRTGALGFSRRLNKKVTFHDPCYLGRHQRVFEAPREIIAALPGVRLVEMKRNRAQSFCCGGGGGRMWYEGEAEVKMAELRAQEAAVTGAQVLLTACPYCLAMLTDAVKTAGLAEQIEVLDLMELAVQAL